MNREEAIAVAKEAVSAAGWPWQEPLHVQRQRKYIIFGPALWHITTNAMDRGGNVRVAIDDASRTIRSKSFARY